MACLRLMKGVLASPRESHTKGNFMMLWPSTQAAAKINNT